MDKYPVWHANSPAITIHYICIFWSITDKLTALQWKALVVIVWPVSYDT